MPVPLITKQQQVSAQNKENVESNSAWVRKNSARGLIIRDTLDFENRNDFCQNNENELLNMFNSDEALDDEANLAEEAQTDRTASPSPLPKSKALANLKNSSHSSTPLMVKLKLQEHGLLDLTNSPMTNATSATSNNPNKADPKLG